ncbi:hypothetical protein GGX14DRAFT_455343 [Mycena pura]|uniref:Aminoglycoside phosphotransferase domain-containing protein n=1 Tax=Mycena pura TaxID=153505 RepID=A0AAD6VBA6_9AGAR|nr:hypothetical protein GGX14DRAFT_455343 [Mycena pura]
MSHDDNQSRLSSSTHSSWSSDSSTWWDDWPPDFDGTGLFQRLARDDADDPPLFRFDVRDVLREVEARLGSAVVDIPKVGKGSNYFGMHMRLADDRDILARVARLDVNWPKYGEGRADEFVDQQVTEVQFEADVYDLLRQRREIFAANLLYYRAPVFSRSTKHRRLPPGNLLGRALFLFEKTEGVNNVWPNDPEKRLQLLEQCARIRAALFSFALPPNFVSSWMTRRPPCASSLSVDIAPTREFAIAFLAAKLDEAVLDSGSLTVALRARQILLQLIPLVMPSEGDQPDLYRLVLEHGDFGLHNMTITDAPSVTSLYDWESGHIVPAILSDPQMSIYVDLGIDGDGRPAISRLWEGITDEERTDYVCYAEHYYRILAEQEPRYLHAIKAGRDARHIWSALKSWRGEDHEQHLGELIPWAEDRLAQVAIEGLHIL